MNTNPTDTTPGNTAPIFAFLRALLDEAEAKVSPGNVIPAVTTAPTPMGSVELLAKFQAKFRAGLQRAEAFNKAQVSLGELATAAGDAASEFIATADASPEEMQRADQKCIVILEELNRRADELLAVMLPVSSPAQAGR